MSEINSINTDELRKEIRKFNNDENVHKLEKYYLSKSMLEIIGESRKELVHSGFIAWILNATESHLLRDFPLRKFLELLVFHSKEKHLKKYKELYDSIIVSDFQLDNILVETERNINEVGRLDIYVEAKIKFKTKLKTLRLIIENKVRSKEHSDQTTKYHEYYESIKKQGDINLYVFLTPLSSLELSELQEPECSSKDYIQINYQSIVDFILEPALKREITEKTKFIINEYLQSLSQPAIDNDDEDNKQGLIMALGKEERDLLTQFWDKNKKLIFAVLDAIRTDPEQEKDTRDSINTALENLTGSKKDRSLYSISFNDNIEVEKIRKSDIGYKTVKLLEKKGLIDDKIINYLINDKSASFPLLKEKKDITEIEIKYSKYRYNDEPELIYKGKEYYIVRNWGKDNTARFIKKMSTKFSALKYKNH